jgi:hypothetical protein
MDRVLQPLQERFKLVDSLLQGFDTPLVPRKGLRNRVRGPPSATQFGNPFANTGGSNSRGYSSRITCPADTAARSAARWCLPFDPSAEPNAKNTTANPSSSVTTPNSSNEA